MEATCIAFEKVKNVVSSEITRRASFIPRMPILLPYTPLSNISSRPVSDKCPEPSSPTSPQVGNSHHKLPPSKYIGWDAEQETQSLSVETFEEAMSLAISTANARKPNPEKPYTEEDFAQISRLLRLLTILSWIC